MGGPEEESVGNFCAVTGASVDRARFFLESSGWDIDTAVASYYETSGGGDDDDEGDFFHDARGAEALTQSQGVGRGGGVAPEHDQIAPPFFGGGGGGGGGGGSGGGFFPLGSAPSAAGGGGIDPSERSHRGPAKPAAGGRGKGAAGRGSSSAPRGGIKTLADIGRDDGSDSDSEGPQEYYTGGEKSGMMVQDPRNRDNLNSIFDRARQHGAREASVAEAQTQGPPGAGVQRSFGGVSRTLSEDARPQAPQRVGGGARQQTPPSEPIVHTITFWRNGFTVDDGPLRTLDDPANRPFLASIERGECPRELEPADRSKQVTVNLVKKTSEEWKAPPEPRYRAFFGTGRTLGATSEVPSDTPTPQAPSVPSSMTLGTGTGPSPGLAIDDSQPVTSIQLRLLDGTRMVARFNYHHTVGDVRRFIDAARPGGAQTDYQLQLMGFPPKILQDLSQTVKDAQLVNSVVIQKI